MGQYTTNVQATSNSTINTEDLYVEMGGQTGKTVKIKRVRVGYGDGTQTAGVDNHFRIKLVRYDTTTAGTTTTYTPVPRDANRQAANASGTTVKIKSGTTACALGTTNVTIVDLISVNGRALYEWLARDDDDMIVIKPASFFCVAIQSAVVSQLFTVSVDHVE